MALGILSTIAVLAATTFAFVALTAADGAESPEAAVQGLFHAISEEDAIGVMESLPPGERSVLLDPLVDTVGELQRLGLLDSFDLDDVPGADIEVDGLTLETTALGEGMTKVRITGGTITGTVIPDDVPVGPKAHELAQREGESIEIEAESGTESLADLELVAVDEGGGWHVSLFYSVAEAIRGDDHPVPRFGASVISPIGSDTPEGAVRGLIEAGLDLDMATAVGYLPPDEMRVAYDYVPLFLDEMDEAADELRSDGFTSSIDRLELSTSGSGSRRQVSMTGLDVTAGTLETSVNYQWDGSCTVMAMTYQDTWYGGRTSQAYDHSYGYEGGEHANGTTGVAEPEDVPAVEPQEYQTRTAVDRIEVCADGSVSFTEDGEDGEDVDVEMYPEMYALPFGTGASLGQTVTVVEHSGRWYVSPAQTMFDSLLTALRDIEESDIDDFFDSWAGWFGTSASYEFAETGSVIESTTATTTYAVDDPYQECYFIYEQLELAYAEGLDEGEMAARVEAADRGFEECIQGSGIGAYEPEAEPGETHGLDDPYVTDPDDSDGSAVGETSGDEATSLEEPVKQSEQIRD